MPQILDILHILTLLGHSTHIGEAFNHGYKVSRNPDSFKVDFIMEAIIFVHMSETMQKTIQNVHFFVNRHIIWLFMHLFEIKVCPFAEDCYHFHIPRIHSLVGSIDVWMVQKSGKLYFPKHHWVHFFLSFICLFLLFFLNRFLFICLIIKNSRIPDRIHVSLNWISSTCIRKRLDSIDRIL